MSTIILEPTASITTGTFTTLLPSTTPAPTELAPQLAPTSSSSSSSTTTTSRIGRSQDPNQNPGYDFFNAGPSMYLYGFLATLVLILGVSVIVGWRGYYTRRMLRRRIDEAIARGVYIPGYSDGNNLDPDGMGRRGGPGDGAVGPRPIIWETWIQTKEKGDMNMEAKGKAREGGEDLEGGGRGWDFQPASVTIVRPLTTEEEERVKEPGAKKAKSSRRAAAAANGGGGGAFHRFGAFVREYWFVRPPGASGASAHQLMGMPAPASPTSANANDANNNVTGNATNDANATGNASTSTSNDRSAGGDSSHNASTHTVGVVAAKANVKKELQDGEGKKGGGLEERIGMAEGVSMTVLITMPSATSPRYWTASASSSTMGLRKGKEREEDEQSGRSGRSGRSSVVPGGQGDQQEEEGEGEGEVLPDMMLGVAEVEIGKKKQGEVEEEENNGQSAPAPSALVPVPTPTPTPASAPVPGSIEDTSSSRVDTRTDR
ncbi:hypothetical protein FRC17_002299 [Serendipita sp. 399]|nr:hypothetical protein FRC17_002299 [Serendipita sp. 399]